MNSHRAGLLLLATCLACAGEAAPIAADWPMTAGPFGQWRADRWGQPIVTDLNLIAVAWESAPVVGAVRVGRSAATKAKTSGEVSRMPGSCSSPIVAGGMVFVSDFQPEGEVAPAELDSLTAEQRAPWAIAAFDVVVALDAATGREAWRAREPGGMRREGGKRTDYGPSPAWFDGVVFSLGTTGTVYAYDGRTGAKRWQSDLPAAAGAKAARAARLAQRIDEVKGMPRPWLGSLAVVPGRVIVPTGNDLSGLDMVDGRVVWTVRNCIHEFSSPTIVRPEGKPLVVVAANGIARAIDPSDGREAWQVTGLGPMQLPVPASDRTILLNMNPSSGLGAGNMPKGTPKLPGRWAAWRISPTAATPAWQAPEGMEWGWAQDSGARRKVLISDGAVLITEAGQKPKGFAMLREEDGAVLFQRRDQGDSANLGSLVPYDGVPRLIEDRLWVAEDEAHGAAKTPIAFDQWRIRPDGLDLLHKNWQPTCTPATAYEVPIDWPYVDGRLYGRTLAGTIACYDLRRKTGDYRRFELGLAGGYRGSPLPLPVRLYAHRDGLLPQAAAYPPGQAEAGLVFGKDRRFARWERADAGGLRQEGQRITGSLVVDHGTGTWPVQVELALAADGAVIGSWTRAIAGLPAPVAMSGTVEGRVPQDHRFIASPWLPDMPWTRTGALPAGTTCTFLRLAGIVPKGLDPAVPKDIALYLDHDGKTFVRSLATSFQVNTAWHEVDAARLVRDGTRIRGTIELCFNRDLWVSLAPDGGSLGATIEIDAEVKADGVAGTCTARWGVPLTWTGAITGRAVAAE
jgi:outer membrane protein assembly factor BamB